MESAPPTLRQLLKRMGHHADGTHPILVENIPIDGSSRSITARAPLPNHKTTPLLETIEKQTLGREIAERDEMREPFFDQVLTIKERLALRYRQTRGHRTSRSGSVKDPNELEDVVTEA